MNFSSGKIVCVIAAILSGIAAITLVAQDPAEAAGAVNCGCHPHKAEKSFVHLPVKNGECQSCHKPSGQKHPKFKKEAFLLTDKGKAGLCNECHERKDTKKHVHPPVAAGDCLDCHDPHQSDSKFQLKAAGAELCYTCHEKSKLDRVVPHKPIAEGKCLSCHDPHQSDQKYMLKAEGANLCMICHDKSQFTGKTVHAPVADGDCSACHAPHGTKLHHLLKRSAPEEMYQSFDKSNFELCFGCHADTLADSQRTDVDTKFRNGMFNLHYVHVNKKEKGRSCKVCHDPHASSQPRLISSKVAGFGRWRIPIRYTKTDVGGTCVVGCHKPKSYNRIDPIQNP
ncbi:MAG: cytochrome C [Geobacteraceae bacterium GWC2_53_11]|nr:MAG: cytochrome C [Geobacteraceae bacterium GWC2_53_11]